MQISGLMNGDLEEKLPLSHATNKPGAGAEYGLWLAFFNDSEHPAETSRLVLSNFKEKLILLWTRKYTDNATEKK